MAGRGLCLHRLFSFQLAVISKRLALQIDSSADIDIGHRFAKCFRAWKLSVVVRHRPWHAEFNQWAA